MGSAIGGDIEGLWNLREQLTGIPKSIVEASDYLSHVVDDIVHDAGWSGDAAEEFKARWDLDAGAALGLAECYDAVGRIVGTLADTLHRLASELGEAADTARRAGVPVPADDGPMVGPVPVDKVRAATAYNQTYSALIGQAHEARLQALVDLLVIYDRIAPLRDGESSPELTKSDRLTLADVVRSLWATPAAHREITSSRLKALRARRAWLNHVKSSPGLFNEVERAAARAEKRNLVGQIKNLDLKLRRIEGGIEGKLPLSKLFGYTIEDAGEDIVGLKFAARWGGAVPVLGLAAAGYLTYVQAKEDHEKGWSWGHAVVADGASNLAGLAAGTAAEAGIAAGLAAAPEGVAAGVAVLGGVVVGYGVGAYAYELVHAGNWESNISHDGIIKGVGESFADAGKAWWDNDVVGMGDRVGNTAKSVWHKVFG